MSRKKKEQETLEARKERLRLKRVGPPIGVHYYEQKIADSIRIMGAPVFRKVVYVPTAGWAVPKPGLGRYACDDCGRDSELPHPVWPSQTILRLGPHLRVRRAPRAKGKIALHCGRCLKRVRLKSEQQTNPADWIEIQRLLVANDEMFAVLEREARKKCLALMEGVR